MVSSSRIPRENTQSQRFSFFSKGGALSFWILRPIPAGINMAKKKRGWGSFFSLPPFLPFPKGCSIIASRLFTAFPLFFFFFLFWDKGWDFFWGVFWNLAWYRGANSITFYFCPRILYVRHRHTAIVFCGKGWGKAWKQGEQEQEGRSWDSNRALCRSFIAGRVG